MLKIYNNINEHNWEIIVININGKLLTFVKLRL